MTTIISAPTKNAAIGVFENDGVNDIFQIKGPDGGVQVHMNANGVIDPPVFPIIRKVTLSAAQLIALHATSAILIPAPGPGLYLLPQSIAVIYKFKTTPFVVTGNDTLFYFTWEGQPLTPDASLATFFDAGFVDQNSSQVTLTASSDGSQTPLAQIINKGLIFGIVDTLSAGDGTLEFVISYTVNAI